MKIAGICLLILGGALLLKSGLYFVAFLIFEKMPHKAGRTLGKLCGRDYKKDVKVWARWGTRLTFTIKHLTKSKYLYCVNNKLYICGFDFWRKPHEVPSHLWVIYFKAFPRISYLEDDENCIGAVAFVVKAITSSVTAISAFCLGVAFLSIV